MRLTWIVRCDGHGDGAVRRRSTAAPGLGYLRTASRDCGALCPCGPGGPCGAMEGCGLWGECQQMYAWPPVSYAAPGQLLPDMGLLTVLYNCKVTSYCIKPPTPNKASQNCATHVHLHAADGVTSYKSHAAWCGRCDSNAGRMCSFVCALRPLFIFPCPCLLYTSPSPRDMRRSRMPSSA